MRPFRLLLWPILAGLEIILYLLAWVFAVVYLPIGAYILELANKLPNPEWYTRHA